MLVSARILSYPKKKKKLEHQSFDVFLLQLYSYSTLRVKIGKTDAFANHFVSNLVEESKKFGLGTNSQIDEYSRITPYNYSCTNIFLF